MQDCLCGVNNLKRQVFRKISVLLLVMTLSFCFTGCRNAVTNEKKQLYRAICDPNIQGVKEVVKNNKSIVNKKMKVFGQAKPLELAVREIETEKVQVEICSELIEAGADINEMGLDGSTNLCWALDNERIHLAEKLIDEGADVNQKDEEGLTPLRSVLRAVTFENHDTQKQMTEKLLKAGAKPDGKLISYLLSDKNNNWGMQYYFIPRIMKWMPNDQITEGISSALYAAIKGDDKELQKQLNSGNIKKTEKNQILAFAAANCGTEILKLMKDQGYDFSWKDSDKVGLIHIAALCNQKEVVEYLLDQGLNGSDETDFFEVDAVAFAVLGNHLETAQLLIQKGKVNYKNNLSDGECAAWSFISAYGGKEAFRSLAKLGYQPAEKEIYHAFEYGSEEQYPALIEFKDAVKVKGEDGSSVLSCFSMQEYGNQFYDLCRRGLRADEDELKDLIWSGRSDLVRKVLEEKMTQGNIRKEALLQSAIDIGDFTMVKYLVKKGADINKYVEAGAEDDMWTPMQMAYARASKDIRKYLEENGGNTSKKDSKGRSCKEIAEEAEAVWNLN